MSAPLAPPAPRPTPFRRLAGLPPSVLLSGAVVLFLALALPPLFGDTETGDENMHLWSGYRHLVHGDYTPNPWHPPVAKLLQAAPLVAMGAHAPEDPNRYGDVPPWSHGYAFLHRSGNNPAALLAAARVPGLLWGVALLVAAYWASRDLFGPPGALVTLGLVSTCPTLLAHAHLATTDVPAAALLLLNLVLFRSFLRSPGAAKAAGCGVLSGLALCTKHNLVFLAPLFILLGLVAYARRGPATAQAPPPSAGSRLRRAAPVAWVALIVAGAYATVWAVYGFRYAPSPDPGDRLSWWFPTPGLVGTFLGVARDHRLLPEAYLYGVAFLRQYMEAGHPGYALGQYSQTGWAWYFPFALLVKTPVPTLVLFGWGVWAACRRLAGPQSVGLLVFLLPLASYWVLAINSTLAIGIRFLLPVLPLLAVLAGSVVPAPDAPSPRRDRVILGLLAATLVGVLSSAPHFLAYFNLPSRVLGEPHRLLADSNLDWGQDLGRLKAYMDRHGIASVKLAYFGNGSPRSLGLRHEKLPGFNLYGRYEPEWTTAEDLAPGDWVALSTTCLVGVLARDRRYYLDRFGPLEPAARIGHSILLYRMPEGSRHAVP